MHLDALDFVVIGTYLVGLFLLGVYFSKRQTSKEFYFLGNRRVPPLLAGISVFATLLSTITYLSVPGEVIRYGIGLYTANLAFFLVLPVVNRLIIPSLMRLRVTSIYEFLGKRFGIEVQSLGATVFIVTRLIWIGLVTYTASFAVSAMTGWSIPSIILVVGVITTFYTTSGGFTAVIWSDFAQFTILVGGTLFIPLYVGWVTGAGPLTWWQAFSSAGRSSVPVFSLDPTVRVTVGGRVIGYFIWNICTHGSDQTAAQRYLSTSSVRAARQSVWIFVCSNVSMIVLLMICGLSLFFLSYSGSGLPVQEFQGQIASRADKVLPEFIATDVPTGISGLMLAALLAAAMSSLSSGINSISSVVVTDFSQRFNILEKYRHSLIPAKVTAILVGIFGIVSALVMNRIMQAGEWTLVDLMERVNHLFVAPLGALFFVGMFFPRAGSKAVLIGFTAGLLTSLLTAFSKEIFGMEQGISFMWIMPFSFFVSLAASFVSVFFLNNSGNHK